MPAEIPSHWMVYFGTDSVAESHEKATAAGAKTMMERTEMPMGALSIAADPQGAVFALYEGQFDD
jgi:predicted enzyme related to lactoylglutathione lyase